MGVRDYPVGPRAYFDMDGVLADFEKYMQEVGHPASIAKLLPTTYLDLEPIPGAVEGIRAVIEAAPQRVFVLTKIPSKNPNAAMQKLLWVRKHVPELRDHVIITPDKGCVGKLGDVLVDDHAEWANAYAFPGHIIEFGPDHDMDWERLVPKVIEHLCGS